MRKIAAFIAILLWVTVGAGPSLAEEKSVLLLPIIVEGQYRPLTEEQLNQEVGEELRQAGIRVLPASEDTPIPTDELTARALAKKKAVDYVVWGSIEFSKDSRSLSSGPPGSAGSDVSPYRFQTTSRLLYQVRVSSSCKLTLMPADKQKEIVLAGSHLPHIHSATTNATPGSARHRKVESRLAGFCVKTLVSHLEEALD